MRKNYLLKLADYLEKNVDTRKEFDLSDWECGTKMCAAGHATKIFKKMGFKLIDGRLCYNGWSGYKAIQHFFWISEKKADYLFNPDSYTTTTNKQEVIKRIRKVCDR